MPHTMNTSMNISMISPSEYAHHPIGKRVPSNLLNNQSCNKENEEAVQKCRLKQPEIHTKKPLIEAA